MTSMTATSAAPLGLPRGRALTADDLELMPDDGHRYELIDGVLVVTPAPRPVHQLVSARLHLILHAVCPVGLQVLYAPLDVRLSTDSVLQPDLVVFRPADLTERNLPTAPVLAIEILSPSTRLFDLHVKKDRLARAGCAHYWVVDPDGPSVLAWRLEGERYVEAARATGDEELVVELPFEVCLVPRALTRW